MSEHMKKEIEEINAKPEFYIDGRVIVKQGRGKYNAAVCLTVISWIEELLKEAPSSPISLMVAAGLPQLKAAVSEERIEA